MNNILLQISFSFDKLHGTEYYEITFRSFHSFESFNLTNTIFTAKNLTPGLQYNITITAYGNRKNSPSFTSENATGRSANILLKLHKFFVMK